jgi:hypothetical protein
VVAALSDDPRRAHHLALAVAYLDVPNAPPEVLAAHFRAAGCQTEAFRFTVQAAGRAAEAFALDRAAHLYREALALAPDGEDREKRTLTVRLADVLATAGHGIHAANAYLSAARSNESDRFALETRAAHELLRYGELERGMVLMDRILGEIGVWLPRSWLLAYALGGALAYWYAWRGVRVPSQEVADEEADRATRQRIDVGQTLALALLLVEPPLAIYLATTSLRRALRAGERRRTLHGIWQVSLYLAAFPPAHEARVNEWIAIQSEAADTTENPRLHADAAMATMAKAYFSGHWRQAFDAALAAEVLLERCNGVAAELYYARAFSVWWLFFIGDLRGLAERARAMGREARDRGNAWALSAMCCSTMLASLMSDDVEAAESDLDDTIRRWRGNGISTPEFCHLIARGYLDLYVGKGVELHERVERRWRALAWAGWLVVPLNLYLLLQLRGNAALLAASQRGAQSRHLLGAVRLYAMRLASVQVLGARPAAALLGAGVAHASGDSARAAVLLTEAADQFENADMSLYAVAARHQLGRLRGDENGARLTARADAYLRAAGVVNPDRFAAMLVPGMTRVVSRESWYRAKSRDN